MHLKVDLKILFKDWASRMLEAPTFPCPTPVECLLKADNDFSFPFPFVLNGNDHPVDLCSVRGAQIKFIGSKDIPK